MPHEYWMGYMGFMQYGLQRNQNPFFDNPDGEDFDNWDMGWWDAQIEELDGGC